MSEQVFISYSWRDLPIVVRIYSDLVRSGLHAWRDEFSASFGKEYKTEIETALRYCSGIIVMDSPNSRRSTYVKDECSLLNTDDSWKNGKEKIAVCLIGNLGETRNEGEVFDGQDGIKHFDFSSNEFHDNTRNYFLAITALCKFWNLNYQSLYPDSSEKDFEDEISKFRTKDADRKILLDEFKFIQNRIALGFPRTIERLYSFNDECRLLQVPCPTPALQLGIELAKASDFDRARKILVDYTTRYGDDPRGWRALGSVLFELNQFREALTAYDKTISLSVRIKENKTSKNSAPLPFDSEKNFHYLFVSRLNRATLLFRLGEKDSAIAEYEAILSDEQFIDQIMPEHFLLISDAYDELQTAGKRKQWIDQGLKKFPGNYNLNLAKGRMLFETGDVSAASSVYEYLVFRDIADWEVYAEYLSILKGGNNKKHFATIFSKAMGIPTQCDKDVYYLGYAYYLNNEEKKARTYYKQSNYQELPYYTEVWN